MTNFAMNALTANSSAIWHVARVILESWRVEYNERRPHSSLGYQTPQRVCREKDEPI